MTKIWIDGQEYEVEEGQDALSAALSLGFNLPYFCWHPALGSVGSCRQCAVKQYKDENDQQGKLVMACMTPAADGTRISIEDPEAKEFRSQIIEWMMVNHPHDCPVCDEGGECHLQDMTVMTGHTYREYSFNKRTYRNQDLGPFINHEMNRCIQCYRCVRFYREYAGGRDFNVFAAHDQIYFGRAADGPLENEFSGNLIEVCPTGVFTDKTFKEHYTRKWDLQTAPSICIGCGLGCNTLPGERYGELRRIRNRYNGEINRYFLCDRGRFGYEFVNSQRRLRSPLMRKSKDEDVQPLSKAQALEQTASVLQKAKRVIGIGSPRASLEDNFALRELVGPENWYLGICKNDDRLIRLALDILQKGPARTPTLKEIEEADVVLVLGEDLTNTAPMMALALRQLVHRKAARVAEKFSIPNWNDIAIREVIQHEKELLFIVTPAETKLDDVARITHRAAPEDIARFGFAVAHFLDKESPAVTDLPEELYTTAENIARVLEIAQNPMIISGTSCASAAVMQAAANIAWALSKRDCPCGLALTVPEPNSVGIGMLGGKSLSEAFEAVKTGEADVAIILDNDLYQRASAHDVDAFLDAAPSIIVLDTLENATNFQANIVLPSATFAESDGTWINNEGRAQRAYQVFTAQDGIWDGWRWLRELRVCLHQIPDSAWQTIEAVMADIANELPLFEPILYIAPPAGFRIAGLKIPRQPARYSGRTAMHANIDVKEGKPPVDLDTPLSFSMEGYEGEPPAALVCRFWEPGWNSVQSLNKFQSEINGPLRGGDPGCRLIEPDEEAHPAYYKLNPLTPAPNSGMLRLVPLYHIFGSEPLSMLTPGIAKMAPKPYLALGEMDAQELQVTEGDFVEVSWDDEGFHLPVKLNPSLPAGVAGAPIGFTRLSPLFAPEWIRIRKETNLT